MLRQKGSTANEVYTYPATSHRLTQVDAAVRSYDANGNTTTRDDVTLNYDVRNRLSQATQGASTLQVNQYNGKGERVIRIVGTSKRLFSYDPAGQLLGEYTATGGAIREYVHGPTGPLAVRQGTVVHAIESDHLGTPRAVIDKARNTAIWQWNLVTNEPFGDNDAKIDPDGDGTNFTMDLRFPGQLKDSAIGLNYNYFRDYDAKVGRYVESDPIGLDGGLRYSLNIRRTGIVIDPSPC